MQNCRLNKRKDGAKRVMTIGGAQAAALVLSGSFGDGRGTSESSDAVFRAKLEGHLDAVKKGWGNPEASQINYGLGWRDDAVTMRLSHLNPKALTLYSGMLTAFRYDRAARFVTGVEYDSRAAAAIQSR
jgi:hypothetical protein